jgi:hypothetical protein
VLIISTKGIDKGPRKSSTNSPFLRHGRLAPANFPANLDVLWPNRPHHRLPGNLALSLDLSIALFLFCTESPTVTASSPLQARPASFPTRAPRATSSFLAPKP